MLKRSMHSSVANIKEYWKSYFDSRSASAPSSRSKSYQVNGFRDKVLVEAIHKYVRRLLLNERCGLVVDCGCGNGSVTSPLVHSGIDLVGLDFSPSMCQLASQNGLETVCGDIDLLATSKVLDIISRNNLDEKYTFFLFCESLGCLPDPVGTLGKIARLHSNSKFLISMPNRQSALRFVISSLEQSRLNYFDLSSVQSSMLSRGRKIEQAYGIVSIPFCFARVVKFGLLRGPLFVISRLIVSNWIIVVGPCLG